MHRLFSLRRVGHARSGLVWLFDAALAKEVLAVLSLLVMLHDGAASAAPGSKNVFDAVTLEVVLFAKSLALHGDGHANTADARGTAKEQAL